MNEKTTYRLYCLDITEKNIEYASQVRFSRITPNYILVYIPDEILKGAVEITDKEVNELTETDTKWLQDVNMVLIAEEIKGQSKERFLGALSTLFDQLEQRLVDAENVEERGEE